MVLSKIKSYQSEGMPAGGIIPQLISLIDSITQYRTKEGVNRLRNIRPCNYVILVVLDYRKTFEVFINIVVCLSRLRDYGVKDRLLETIAAFFERRFQSIRISVFLTEMA